MKRFRSACASWAWLPLLAALLTCITAMPAQARFNAGEDIQWSRANTVEGLAQNGFYVRKDFTTGAASKVDTTEAFFMYDAVPVRQTDLGGSAADSLALGRLAFYSDSTTAGTEAWGSPSIVIQANWGANESGWETAVTLSPKPTAAAKQCVVPILSVSGANAFGINYAQRFWWVGPRLRAIVTWTSSTGIHAVRCKLIKNVSNQ